MVASVVFSPGGGLGVAIIFYKWVVVVKLGLGVVLGSGKGGWYRNFTGGS